MIMRWLLAVLLAAAGLSPATAAPADPLSRFYEQRLSWQACLQKLECASFDVPLDYRRPSGRTITITAARSKATGDARGSLVVNPGGPGGSGVRYIRDAQYVASAAIRKSFDLVSFDPRGLGRSTPLKCFTDAQTDAFLEIDQTPDTAAEQRALRDSARNLINACKRADAELMQHVSTIEVARDMDVLRALLGEPRLRYLGKSWGTALGQAYAATFPSRVGAFVLDGGVDVTLPIARATRDQARGFEQAANRFIAWCVKQGECVLGKTSAAARSRLIDFFAQLDRTPLKTSNPRRPLTEEQAWTAFLGPLYVALGGWDWLNIGLTEALRYKNGSELQAIHDWFVDRDNRGRFSDNGNTLIYAVNCLDRDGAQSLSLTKSERAALLRELPIMGTLLAWGDEACAQWPYSAQESLRSIRVRSVPPMLILGSTYDPATPIVWSRSLQRQIPKSVLLERVGDGHTAYANGSACIDRKVDAFLLSSNVMSPTLPKNGTRCD